MMHIAMFDEAMTYGIAESVVNSTLFDSTLSRV